MFERYTEAARRVLFFARYEVSELGATSIEPEHLLLGLLTQPRPLIVQLLAAANVSPERLRAEVGGRIVHRKKISESTEIPFSTDAKRVLEMTAEEANAMGYSYIGTEHLLLALLREERSVAGSVLAGHGLRLHRVRDDLVKLLDDKGSAGREADAQTSQYATPAQQILGIRMFLEDMGRNVTGDEARTLIHRICADLEALDKRLS